MSRSSELLKAAAEALDDGRDPLHLAFLSEHEVTLDECYSLAEWLAVGASLMAWAIENPHHAKTAMAGATDAMRMDTITRVLSKLNEEKA
jgi:hypothetical protein